MQAEGEDHGGVHVAVPDGGVAGRSTAAVTIRPEHVRIADPRERVCLSGVVGWCRSTDP